ncbi:MAG TPA: DUF6492 family protein [Stellaceae bacterium]|nr:DUF6492 family protein [Stellaceae bacterium]
MTIDAPTLSAACHLTLAGESDKDLLLYVDGLIDSLAAHWEEAEPLELAVICPEAELATLGEAIVPAPRLRVSFLAEEQLSPTLANRRLPAELRGRLARLLYAASCPGDFCLVLEPGAFCIRPISTQRLVPQGRARTEWEAKSKHPDWWRGAARMLGRGESAEPLGLGVCPMVLARDLARQTLDLVGRANRQDPAAALAAAGTGDTWTENALYCLAGEGRSLLDWHWPPDSHPGGQPNRLHSDVNLWSRDDFSGWDPARWRALAAHGYFLVVNRHAPFAPDEVLPPLYRMLPLGA